jgi:hypothetical protein
MLQRISLVATGVALSLTTACARPATPTATAAKVEHTQCPGVDYADASLLRGTTVLRAEPIYTRQPNKSGDGEHVSGVKLVIRPPEGVSAERLTRTLQCHSARALLGQVDRSQLPDDPYWLPDEWLDISVVPENGNYAVSLRADSVSKNLEVFNRVVTYADSHGILRTATP